MSIARPLLVGGLLVVAACASLEDIRASQPVRSGYFSANYRDVAICVQHSLLAKYPMNNAVFEREKRAVLTHLEDVSVGFLQSRKALWELVIVQDAPTKSRIEFRSAGGVIPGTYTWADDVWPAVEKCGRS